jgi:hypothetical protein
MVSAFRLSHDELRQIVADHVNAKFAIDLPAAKISIYPDPSDRTCCRIEASADVSDHAAIATSPVRQGH